MPDDPLSPTDALVQLAFAVHGALGAVADAHDLSLTQLRLLGILRDREPGMLDLARVMALEKSSVSGLVDRAAKRGLVERTTRAHDGRAVHVRLTRDGERLRATIERQVDERVAALLAGVPKADRAHLVRIATRLVRADVRPDAAAG
jgi:MarR family transcriptional regulator, lower aerobic nicotinate degradation pathway regulator